MTLKIGRLATQRDLAINFPKKGEYVSFHFHIGLNRLPPACAMHMQPLSLGGCKSFTWKTLAPRGQTQLAVCTPPPSSTVLLGQGPLPVSSSLFPPSSQLAPTTMPESACKQIQQGRCAAGEKENTAPKLVSTGSGQVTSKEMTLPKALQQRCARPACDHS